MIGLIDESEIYDAKIRRTEVKKLKESDKVKRILGDGAKTVLEEYKTSEEFIFDTLYINDGFMFDELVIGSKMNKGIKHDFIHMSLFVSDMEGDRHNLKPLNKAEYEARCCKVKEYIDKEFGLDLNLDNKKFKLLALNRTFKLDTDIEEYWELFELIWLIAPAKYTKKDFVLGGNDEIIGVYLENGLIKIKIYDKSRQLKFEKNIEIEEGYMRVEVVLKDVRKIKEVFGTTLVSEITDEQMETFFNYILMEDIFSKIDEYIESSKKQLYKIAKDEKKRNKLNWTRNFFLKSTSSGIKYKKRGKATKIDLLFDVEQSLEIIKIETGSNYKKRLKTLQKDIDDMETKKNNLSNYREVKIKVFGLN